MNKRRIFITALAIALGIGILRVPMLQAVVASFNSTIRIVDSAGNVINGVASAVTASYNSTVRVVDSTGHVIDSFGGPSPALPQIATVTLTSAQVKTLDYIPVTMIPAQGANKAILVTGASFESIFGTRAYTSLGGTTGLYFTYNGVQPGTAADIVKLLDTAFPLLTVGSSRWLPVLPLIYPIASVAPSTLLSVSNRPVQLVDTTAESFNNGPIVTATLHAGGGGAGYVANDTGVIDPAPFCSGGDATYKVLTVSGGAVVTFQVTGAGTLYELNGGGAGDPAADCGNGAGAGYLTGTGGAQPGVGTGFKVDVSAVTAGDSTLAVTVYYNVVTLQ